MPGLFGVLDLASRSMFVVQTNINTTAHNVANVDTPGFSRQRGVLAAATPFPTGVGVIGNGVEQLTVQRISDGFVQNQLVREDASGAASRIQAEVLGSVEQLLNEQLGGGISAPLSALYSAFSDLASATAPGAPIEREGVLSAARSVIDTFHGLDGELRAQQQIADRRAADLLPAINTQLQRIAQLNGAIVNQEIQQPANDLRDERDRAMRDLAELIDVDSFERENGAMVVMVAGGFTGVEGTRAFQLVAEQDTTNPFDPTYTRVMYDDGTTRQDVTADVGSGELGGLLRARDTLLPAAIRSLDVLAYNLAESVNGVHNAGVGVDGSTGDFFAPLAAVEDAASLIALDANVAGNADAIAAGFSSAPGDNQNALALAELRKVPTALALPGDPPGPPSGPTRTLLEHAAAVSADVGIQVNGLNAAVEQHARVLEVLESRRDAVSGVSLDEEMSNLVRLQAAFQANARIVGVIDELLEDVVSLI